MTSEFEGMEGRKCPDACAAEHCVISTLGVCKHPRMTGDDGCGPITLGNRARALAFLGIFAADEKQPEKIA
jgi:hypothetical protein